MTEQARKNSKNKAIVIGLFLLFFLPILISWFLVFFTDYTPGGGGTQHGILINPLRQLQDLELMDPIVNRTSSLHGYWNMVSVIDGDCDDTCINDLYRMRQIRLATGNEADRVQRVVYFSDALTASRAGELFNGFSGQLLLPAENITADQLALFNVDGIDRQHSIYLIDPAGYIMMNYPAGTEPSGIIKDMKRLLRISKLD